MVPLNGGHNMHFLPSNNIIRLDGPSYWRRMTQKCQVLLTSDLSQLGSLGTSIAKKRARSSPIEVVFYLEVKFLGQKSTQRTYSFNPRTDDKEKLESLSGIYKFRWCSKICEKNNIRNIKLSLGLNNVSCTCTVTCYQNLTQFWAGLLKRRGLGKWSERDHEWMDDSS